jgi:hypothetical protein
LLFSEGADNIRRFSKGKLDLAFRNKVIEIEEKKTKEAIKRSTSEEETSEEVKDTENRKMVESIISNLISNKVKTSKCKEPDIYEAYQIILSEHYKKTKKQTKQNSSVVKSLKHTSISTPKTGMLEIKQLDDDEYNLGNDMGKCKEKQGILQKHI